MYKKSLPARNDNWSYQPDINCTHKLVDSITVGMNQYNINWPDVWESLSVLKSQSSPTTLDWCDSKLSLQVDRRNSASLIIEDTLPRPIPLTAAAVAAATILCSFAELFDAPSPPAPNAPSLPAVSVWLESDFRSWLESSHFKVGALVNTDTHDSGELVS